MKVVGIGASAGGIEAFKVFFQNMPVPNGMAFIVVLHLSPDRASMLAEVLSHWTPMPVEQASDGIKVIPEHIFVIPPNSTMTIKYGRLHLQARTLPLEATAIDIFFASLAQDFRFDAIGIVLSGTGCDGALGLKAIKSCGGIALAQGSDGTSPQFSEMPSSAIATGVVDLILPVEEMPERILRLAERAVDDAADETQPDSEALTNGDNAQTDAITEANLAICGILYAQVGHDFSGYKVQTFTRRVRRRTGFLGLDIASYVERLRTDPHEVALLFQDLLIGVTSFFRDFDTFQALQDNALPPLFEDKVVGSTVRVWVPGCATGEEAYSMAILLREFVSNLQVQPKLQIFATDIDEPAIAVARAGRYPPLLLKDMSQSRLERFFTLHDGSYMVRKEIRDICTFSVHSIIRDPPFSRIDMISCRNLLIYLDTELQSRVIPAFHYALIPGGVLVLGGSETVSRHGDLFVSLDKKNRIFRRRSVPTPGLHLSTLPKPGAISSGSPGRHGPRSPGWLRSVQTAGDRVLDRFAPPFVVVNSEGEVLHFSGRTGRYLEPPFGVPSQNLVSMARRGLRVPLRAALRRVADSERGVEEELVRVETDGGTRLIRLIVEPMPGDAVDRTFMVLFVEVPDAIPQPSIAVLPASGSDNDATIDQLEQDLNRARDDLQSVSEDYESAMEELKSANEELHSVNEELQSSNEELETSKEEIQSINEELQTVNAQLSGKVDELDRTASDLRNLFDSTQVATVFLDRFMIIRSFTPAMGAIYNLIPSDHGRPLTDIVSQVDYNSLRDDVRHVLDTLEPFERRVSRYDASLHYLMRILPYRASDNNVDGVLITFVDVSTMVQAERHQRRLVDELNHRVRNMLTVVISVASRTLRQAKTMQEFSDSFLGRVNALAAAYTLLSREHWTAVPLNDVLNEELAPFLAKTQLNLSILGPMLMLTPRGALALGMVTHELATNAVKYGGLSVPYGGVDVRWHVEEQPVGKRLVWLWSEHGGPPVEPPTHRGFGLSMIERTLSHELRGEAKLDFRAEGLQVTLHIPFALAIAGHNVTMESMP